MDFWNNPFINSAAKALTPGQKDDYKKIGEAFYSDSKMNMIQNTIDAIDEPIAVLAYIESGLMSGLHPADLSNEELSALCEHRGEKWYEKYGYTRQEVPEPGLGMHMKQHLEKELEKKARELKE